MANITSYPTATPTGSDLVIGTDMSTTPISTKTFTIDSINSLAYDATFPFVFNTTSKTGIQSSTNTASGSQSIAMGLTTTASESRSTAMGQSTVASGDVSTAMGKDTKALGDTSTAIGDRTTASGSKSTAMGDGTTASGTTSTAMGFETTASGSASTAMGDDTIASGAVSTAMGEDTIASGYGSTAMGDATTAFGRSSTSMGQFNVLNTGDNATSYAVTNTAFSIGNGTNSSSRSDAFKVLFNGTTTIAGSITGTSIIKSGGASTEYLMADGSVTTGSGQVNSLTTTGTTGASTLISGVLNVPEYAGDANPLTYSTQLFQTGTNNPQRQALVVDTLLAEGAGGFRRVTFTRSGVGDYRARVTYTLATNTTNLNIMFGDSICRVTNKVNGSDGTGSYREWSFETRDFNGTLSDGLLSGNNGGYMTITLYA